MKSEKTRASLKLQEEQLKVSEMIVKETPPNATHWIRSSGAFLHGLCDQHRPETLNCEACCGDLMADPAYRAASKIMLAATSLKNTLMVPSIVLTREPAQ